MAQAQDFSSNKELAIKQRLAVASRSGAALYEGARALYSLAGVQDLHRELFGRLPAQDWKMAEGQTVSPGVLLDREVSVGLHIAPVAASVSSSSSAGPAAMA